MARERRSMGTQEFLLNYYPDILITYRYGKIELNKLREHSRNCPASVGKDCPVCNKHLDALLDMGEEIKEWTARKKQLDHEEKR